MTKKFKIPPMIGRELPTISRERYSSPSARCARTQLVCPIPNRAEIVLGIIEFAVPRVIPVGPNVPVEWQTGSDPSGQAPSLRPPNIVLILAGDLGWNDLTFGGGGVVGGTVPTPHIDSLAAEGANFVNGVMRPMPLVRHLGPRS